MERGPGQLAGPIPLSGARPHFPDRAAGELWLRFLSGPDIDSLGLSSAEIVAAVEDAVRAHGDGRAVVEPRVHLVPDNDGAGHFNVLRGHLRVPGAPTPGAPTPGAPTPGAPTPGAPTPGASTTGVVTGGVSGVKVVGDFVANYAAGLPSELGLLTLYDPQTGVPLSIMDATLITACRTGAMTAVGARYLARPDSRVLGHVGARGTALWNVVLLDELFDLDEIRITSRRPESREAFAGELATVTDTRVRVAATPEETFDGADILVEASRLTEPEPLLRTAWVKPGAFVVPYGTISAVELDLLDVMDKVVVDDWREAQSGRFGALRRHVDTGRLSAASLYAELGQIVAGHRPGRERNDERILLWHRGLAILDIAVGVAILRRAEQQDVGTMLRYR
jgi:alanine dehydrogenase